MQIVLIFFRKIAAITSEWCIIIYDYRNWTLFWCLLGFKY